MSGTGAGVGGWGGGNWVGEGEIKNKATKI